MKKKENNVIEIPPISSTLALMTMAQGIEELRNENKKMAEMAARTILQALDAKDHYTFGHSMRVAYFSLVMGKEIGLEGDDLYDLELAAIFHDVGKIGTPDHVLNKPSRLSEEEFAIMKKHPENSAEILKDFTLFQKVAKYAKHHHERYDGRGYPDGLKGDDIPVHSRIILIADTFDAMTSTRPYRKGLPYEVAFDELKQFTGSQFDPVLVDAFIRGMNKESEKGEEEFFIPIMEKSFAKNAA